eukprot:12914311-Heterocapsa_arctica.AAC.1
MDMVMDTVPAHLSRRQLTGTPRGERFARLAGHSRANPIRSQRTNNASRDALCASASRDALACRAA